MNIPDRATAGDIIDWDDDAVVSGLETFDSSYTLTYELRGPSTKTQAAAAKGTGWHTSLDLSGVLPGAYVWAAIITKTGVRRTVGDGKLTIDPDIAAQSAGYDGRTAAAKALADAEAALANLTASGARIGKYTIGSRSAEYFTAAQLIEAISYWRTRVITEGTADSIAQGLGNPRRLQVRFAP